MPLMSREVYEALREIGVSDDQAVRTAEALALPNRELSELRGELGTVRTDIAVVKTTLEHVQHRLTILTWSIGIGFSLVMAVLLVAMNWLWQLVQRIP